MVELDRFGENLSEAGHEIFSVTFLAIDARNLFYPADPPVAVLLQHRGVLRTHERSVRRSLSPVIKAPVESCNRRSNR
jgi:hypothetical protein